MTPVNRRPDLYRASLKDGVRPTRPCFGHLLGTGRREHMALQSIRVSSYFASSSRSYRNHGGGGEWTEDGAHPPCARGGFVSISPAPYHHHQTRICSYFISAERSSDGCAVCLAALERHHSSHGCCKGPRVTRIMARGREEY